MQTQKMPIEELVEDFEIYPRTMVSAPHVATLCDALQAGQKLPPIVADRKSKRVTDGLHRLRAAKRLKLEKIDCELRSYKSEAEMFADAVRMNSAHGRPLVPFERKRAVERLRRYGTDDNNIVEIIRAPVERVLEIVSRFGVTESGAERAVKASHEPMLAGETLSVSQIKADEKRDGMNPTYHARQLIIALSSGLWTPTVGFQKAMDELCKLWEKARKKRATA